MPDYDVVAAITDLSSYLKDNDTSGYYTQYIKSHFSYDEDARSFALRLIIHYIGDVHQPLHSTAAVNYDYPTGDRGGNSEKLPSKGGASNLHAVWDSIIYEYTGYPSLPLSSSAWTTLGNNISGMADNHYVPNSEYYANNA